MKMKLIGLVSATMLAWAAIAAPASAGVWNFYSLTGNPSAPGSTTWNNAPYSVQSSPDTMASFSMGGLTLDAISATSSGCTDSAWCEGDGNIYSKNAGAGEQGLGLTNDNYNNNEISNPYGIYLNISEGMFSSVKLGSVQSGETWSVWGEGANGWQLLGNGVSGGVVNFNVPSGYDAIIVGDPSLYNTTGGTSSNNIVLESVTTVPEPGTLALLGLGLAGVAFAVGRRRRAKFEV